MFLNYDSFAFRGTLHLEADIMSLHIYVFASNKNTFWLIVIICLLFSFALQVGWKRRHTIDHQSTSAQASYIFYSYVYPPSLHPWQDTSPDAPSLLKTKTALKQFSSQLPQRLKTAKAPLQLSTLTCALSPYLLWYSLHVSSHCCVLKPIYLPNGSCILCM